jgi:hypothetical protein
MRRAFSELNHMLKKVLLTLFLISFPGPSSFAEVPCVELPAGFVGLGLRKLETPRNCLEVVQIYPGGPGDLAGIEAGDLIIAVNDSMLDCNHLARGTAPWPKVAPGDQIKVGVLRGGQPLDRLVTVSAQPTEISQANDRSLRMEAAINLEQRLIRDKQAISIVPGTQGRLEVRSQLPAEELALLQWFFEQRGTFEIFERTPALARQNLFIKVDPATKEKSFEPAEARAISFPEQQ